MRNNSAGLVLSSFYLVGAGLLIYAGFSMFSAVSEFVSRIPVVR